MNEEKKIVAPMSAEGIKRLRDLLTYRHEVSGPGLAYFSPEHALELLAAYDAEKARADSLYNKLQIASLKAKQDELAILKEKERAARAKLELERAEAENARLTAELAPIKAVHAIMQTDRRAVEGK